MDAKFDWVQDLVKAEELIEETGVIDFTSDFDPDRTMIGAALTFLTDLRAEFNQAIELFNELRPNRQSHLKIFSIAKTPSDFMLFRNGLKLVFSLKQPGVISIRSHFLNPAIPAVANLQVFANTGGEGLSPSQFRGEEDLIKFVWGPFNEAQWTYNGKTVKVESIVKFYLTKFVKDTNALN